MQVSGAKSESTVGQHIDPAARSDGVELRPRRPPFDGRRAVVAHTERDALGRVDGVARAGAEINLAQQRDVSRGRRRQSAVRSVRGGGCELQ